MSIPDADVPPEVIGDWILALFAVFVVWIILERWMKSLQNLGQRVTLLTLAIATGVITTIDLSPFGVLATELAELSRIVPVGYRQFVATLLRAETVFTFLYGMGKMWSGGGFATVILYLFAFFGGLVMLYSPTVGFLFIGFALLTMESLASSVWRSRHYGLSRSR